MATTLSPPTVADSKEKISDPMDTVIPSKEYKWWLNNIDHLTTPERRKVLENYSNIPPEDVRQHIYDIRKKAWAVRQYPCTGMARFLDNLLAQSPVYSDIVARLKKGDSFIDIGCFLGQELRQLVWDLDGAPTTNIHAIDIVNHWDLGYEFFKDKDRFQVDFFQDDMLQPGEKLRALQGTMDVILVNQIFHQWGIENQIEGAIQLVKLSRARPGSLILGNQAGVPEQRELLGPKGSKYRSLVHSPQSWKDMWDEVGKRTGTQWKTESKLLTWEQLGHDPEETAYMGRDILMLEFVITRQ
ncbi:hypothetical protein SS1G_04080 [Sclerotinia sclerotiorum 1980 UF-70]|uniref:Methyltransferase domain-containing protein n=2 Tax=Sclerotinia sclerotiorum (strain ATCC 18683 / 1980 / Ss-1) TaxID=665079 RepID=A7EFI9_SCLS1|nr:hypothetical protein SS1G_04080 [Sclerotinia sclerotiorum 1980 UF-70]APA07193.1 hypothetical protein sscle_02g019630 [Sclerotinia sclerotiorum 1980 UF-70]EDO01605.1 hypothetical protein SS1G_04080 [Sclerotinia sclerotiorum 1980 UF-70]